MYVQQAGYWLKTNAIRSPLNKVHMYAFAYESARSAFVHSTSIHKSNRYRLITLHTLRYIDADRTKPPTFDTSIWLVPSLPYNIITTRATALYICLIVYFDWLRTKYRHTERYTRNVCVSGGDDSWTCVARASLSTLLSIVCIRCMCTSCYFICPSVTFPRLEPFCAYYAYKYTPAIAFAIYRRPTNQCTNVFIARGMSECGSYLDVVSRSRSLQITSHM